MAGFADGDGGTTTAEWRPRKQAIDCLCFVDLLAVGDHGALLLQQLGRNLLSNILPIQVKFLTLR